MRKESLDDLVGQAVFLQRQAHSEIHFEVQRAAAPLIVECDGRQITQALTNLLQNAIDGIQGRLIPEEGELPPGRIDVKVWLNELASVTVSDNGRGLPVEERDRLTEPYVTTRAKGTGLGLAIVKKIMEDHSGTLELTDNPGGGASVTLAIPLKQPATAETGSSRAST
jgi:two-component system nitrogen regulation sensor histidine kinase NtrY